MRMTLQTMGVLAPTKGLGTQCWEPGLSVEWGRHRKSILGMLGIEDGQSGRSPTLRLSLN